MPRFFVFLFTLILAAPPTLAQTVTETHPFTLFTASGRSAIVSRLPREPYTGWLTRLTGEADEILALNVAWGDTITPTVTQAMYGKLLAAAYALTDSGTAHRAEWGGEAAECLNTVPTATFTQYFTSDLEISEASVYWAEAYDLLAGSGFDFEAAGAGMETAIRERLAALREYMSQYDGFSSSAGTIAGDFPSAAYYAASYSDNHHVKLFAGLTVLSLTVYGEPGSADDYTTARSRLFACLDNMTITGSDDSPAGGWAEGPSYQEYTAREYLPALTALTHLGLFDYTDAPEIVNTDLLLPRMVMPDGHMPPFDDNEAPVNALTGLLASRHHGHTDSGALLWLWERTGSPVGMAFLPDYLAQFDDAAPVPANPDNLGWNRTEFFPESGFTSFRSSWEPDARYLLLLSEHGEARENGQAHEHPDPNAFILHAYGEMLMLDSGYGGFSAHDATRFAENHNIVLVDGEGPAAASKSFVGLWFANGSDAELGNSFTTAGLNYALSRTDYQNTYFDRHVVFPGGRYFLLYDTLASSSTRTFTLLLHGNGGGSSGGSFAPVDGGGLWTRDAASIRSFTAGTNDLTQGPAALVFDTEDMQHAVYQRAPLLTHTMLKVSQEASDARFLTVLLPQETGGIMPESSALASSPAGNGAGIRIALGDTTDCCMIRQRGASVSFAAGAGADTLTTDADFAWCRLAPSGTLAQMLMVNGTTLRFGGQNRVTASRPATLSADWRDPAEVTGWIAAGSSGVTITVHDCVPSRILFMNAEIPFTVSAGNTIFTVSGSGEWRADGFLQPPSDVLVSDVPEDQGHSLRLSWTASPSENDGLVEWYRIFRSRFGELTDPLPLSRFTSLDSLLFFEERYTILVDSVAAGITTFTDPFVPMNGAPYYYWVQAAGHAAASKPAPASFHTAVGESPPQRFRLGGAFPNPFNPSTTLTFTLPEEIRAILRVYDVTGRTAAVLLDRTLCAGEHSVTWNAAGLPSGVYLYSLRAGNHRAAGKMLLLK